jgi:phage-related holin
LKDILANFTHLWNELQTLPVFKFIAGLVVTAFAEYQQAIGALFILMMLDLILGIIKAAQRGKLKSSVARDKTLVKFVSYSVIGIAAGLFDDVVLDAGVTIAGLHLRLVALAVTYLAATELLSVVSNLEQVTHTRINLPGLNAIRQWRDDEDKRGRRSGDQPGAP